MDESWKPWSDYPALTQDRLLIVGDIIRSARSEALNEHRPDKWETNWSLGVRQYERTNGSISYATQQYPWLRVISGIGGGPVQYVFAVGEIPIRVCRGDGDDVSPRYQEPCFPELDQQYTLIALEQTVPEGRFLRIAVENDADGSPVNIYLHEMDESGKPIRSYVIPVLAAMVLEFSAPPAAVDLPPVVAEAVDDEAEAETLDEDNKKTGSDE
jgi:hypothetical protein